MLYFALFLWPGIRVLASTTFGLVTKDAVLLSSSGEISTGQTIICNDHDWIHPLGERTLVALSGDAADCREMLDILHGVEREHALDAEDYSKYPISVKALAHYCRSTIAEVLRSKPLNVNVLFAGWESSHLTSPGGKAFEGSGGSGGSNDGEPVLYVVDRLASLRRVNFAAHGRELPIILGVLDMSFGIKSSLPSSSSSSFSSLPLQLQETAPSRNDGRGDGSVMLDRAQGARIVRTCWQAVRRRSTEAGPSTVTRTKGVDRHGIFELNK